MNYIIAIEDTIDKTERILPKALYGYKPIEGTEPGIDYQKYTGGFCVVYPLACPGKPKKCIRLWHEKYNIDLVKKLADLLKELHNSGADFIIGYDYYDEGLKLDNDNGEVIPAVVMDWIEGDTLIDYIKKNCVNSMAIKRVANEFYNMISFLHREGLAHGDLSCDNIMVKPNGKLVLIDYDSFYAPTLPQDIKQTIKGTPGYQHPERQKSLYLSKDMDNFSQQVIYLSLIAIAQDSSLVDEKRCLVADKKMFFEGKDFKDDNTFVSSEGYKAIASIDNSEVKNRLEELRKAVNSKLSDVRSIVEFSMRPQPTEQRGTDTSSPTGTSTPTGIPNPTPNPARPRPIQTPPIVTPWYKQWYTWVGAAILMAFLYFTFGKSDSNKNTGEPVKTEVNVLTAIGRLEGNYTLREKNAGVLVNGIRTAAIKKTSDTQARILVVSEYGPEIYEFSLDASGSIESEQLGKGEITYNEKLDKITLTFKQGERICEFTK
jgi:serine/threonine protein kinase